MQKICILFLLMHTSFAFALEAPFFCRYGKVENSYPEPEACTSENLSLFGIIKLEYQNLGYCKSSPGFTNNNMMDGHIEVEIGKYLLIGNDIDVKADGDWLGNGNGHDEPISFYDSVAGYKGSDETNTDGNAYYKYNLSGGYNSGAGQIWVINNDHYLACSKKDVFFQYGPYLSRSGATTPFNVSSDAVRINFPSGIPIYYQVDWNSKAIKENIPSKVTLYARYSNDSGRNVVGTANVTQQQGTISISPSGYSIGKGVVSFYAEINDGTYSTGEIHLGNFTYVPSMPTACLQACPASLGYYRAQCQFTSSACHYKVW